ncbi:MAG: AmmeMemoRadiSam system protein B [Planctomycetota bacterium]|jgi:AmmeMemoRadiSam system protein B
MNEVTPPTADRSPPTIERPAFRHLEVRRVEHGGQAGIVLHDPLGIAPEQVFVPDGLLAVVALFNGERTIPAIEAEITHGSSQVVPNGFVAGIVDQLDQRLVLQSERFRAALDVAMTGFLAQPVRAARHAGSLGYPAEQATAREALSSMVRRLPTGEPRRPTPRGLVAPHLDLVRGREGYVLAYSYLAECQPADLYVVFGTGHQGPGAPVTGLAMDWETPLGTLRTDRDFVAVVHDSVGPPDRVDQFLHRDEHSLEFQMLFLAHILDGHSEDAQVAGFLCGQLPSSGENVLEESYVGSLLDAFRSGCDGRRVCFIGGADLAHVGPVFGDVDQVDQARLDRLAQVERNKLAHLVNGDPGAFHRSVEQDGNPDRICGTTPMVLAAALAGGAAHLLHYDQARAPDGSQVVSFCSMVFT